MVAFFLTLVLFVKGLFVKQALGTVVVEVTPVTVGQHRVASLSMVRPRTTELGELVAQFSALTTKVNARSVPLLTPTELCDMIILSEKIERQ